MMTSRSRGSNRRFVGAILLLAFLACCACGGGPVAPTDSNFLDGRVVDGSGQPVAGASVSLFYTFEIYESTMLHSPSPGRTSAPHLNDLRGVLIRYEVLDYMRRSVRVLVDNPRGEEVPGPTAWDWTDGSGSRVPNGVYSLCLRSRNLDDGSEQYLEGKVVVYYRSLNELLLGKHAVTDANGSYRIPMGLLPIGEKLTLADPQGYTWEDRISPRVLVYALRREGNDIRFVRNEIMVEDRFASRRVDLTLP